jgi:type IV secretory pathway TrbD component
MGRTVPVEDPIHTLFDLSDAARWEAPKVREAYQHSMVILGVVLFVLFVGDLAVLGVAIVVNHWVFVGFVVMTLILAYVLYAFLALRRADDLIAQFFGKLLAIDAVEKLEPDTKIPTGATPLERYARFLWMGDPTWSPQFRGALSASLGPRTWVVGGRAVHFDLCAETPGSFLYRQFGWGDPGLLLLVRQLPAGLSPAAVNAFVEDVQAVAGVSSALPSRVVLLRPTSEPIPDELYARITRQPIPLAYRLTRMSVPLQVVSERPDGSYDFTPHLVDLP